MMQISQTGLGLIKQFEGCELSAYQDSAGIWTIGYGHIHDVRPGETILQETADEYLADDVMDTETIVSACVLGVSTTQNQFDAMVSLAYNIGTGAFRTSSVLREHRAGNFAAAAAAFLLWDKIHQDGQLVESVGLLNRRQAEAALYERAST